jgi:hypothetical protein
MAFLLDDTIRSSEPPEAELRSLYETRPDLVRTPPRTSFTQVFFTREHGEDRAAREARTVLARLSEGDADPEEYGDRLLLGSIFIDQDERSLSDQFGAAFAQAILSAEPDHWSGPVASGYGLHLVKVTHVQPSRIKAFDEVRERLAQEWHRQRQETAGAQLYAELLRKYQIVADPPVRPLLGSHASRAEAQP